MIDKRGYEYKYQIFFDSAACTLRATRMQVAVRIIVFEKGAHHGKLSFLFKRSSMVAS